VSAALRMAKLVELAKINPGLAEPMENDALVSFLPMSAVTAETGSTTTGEDRRFCEVSKGYTPFLHEDILVAKITPCFENGKIAQATLAHRIGFGSTEFHVVRPHAGKADARYLLHFLRQEDIRRDGERKMTGSAGQRRVPEHFLAGLDIPVPSLSEQCRIAEILDRADALRTKHRAALAQLDILTQSILLDMFGDPATNPKGWPLRTIKEIGHVTTGSTPPSAKPDMFDGPIPFITPGDLESDSPAKRSLTEAGAGESVTVWPGATLVCCIGATIGKIGKTSVRSAFNQQINAIEWGETIDDSYGFTVLRFFKPTIISWAASTTLPILKKSAFERIEIPVPPIDLQRKFSRRLSAVGVLEGSIKASLASLNELFGTLQSRAFRGEL